MIIINIVPFTTQHLPRADALLRESYDAARRNIPVLPQVEALPSLTDLASNGLGFAALEGEALVGYLGAVGPFGSAFRSTDAVGVFSPYHGNAVSYALPDEQRAKVFARLYQAAGEAWVAAGAASHAVCLHAWDEAALGQFFRYGFGMRCADAVRSLGQTGAACCPGYELRELEPAEFPALLPLDRLLNRHIAASPCFINRGIPTEEEFRRDNEEDRARFFAAFHRGEPVAFAKVGDDGEAFPAERMPNLCGAFCLPEHRGKGLYPSLLEFVAGTLGAEGNTRLGVNYETINPTAWHFWGKHFTPYTTSVVRRIDEHSLPGYSKA